jgi:hypothetical protein
MEVAVEMVVSLRPALADHCIPPARDIVSLFEAGSMSNW